MNNSDLQRANAGMIGAVFEAVTSTNAAAQDAANLMFENDFEFVKAADDGAGTTNTAEVVLGRLARRAMLVGATFTPNGATGLVANATNYAAVLFQSRDGAGGSPLSLGQTNTQPVANGGTGNFAQWTNVPLTVTAFDPNNAVIPAGGLLTMNILKTGGAGVVFPAGTFSAQVRYL